MVTQFAFRLVCGMSAVWLLLPRRQISSGYFRIQMLVVLGLAVLAGLTANQPGVLGSPTTHASTSNSEPILCVLGTQLLSAGLAAVAFLGSVLWTLERRQGGQLCMGAVFALAVGGLIGHAVPIAELSALVGWLRVSSELATAAILGTTMSGMLLGHWYLTATGMALEPLLQANRLFAASAILRAVVSAVCLGLAIGMISGATPTLWLALRWISGIVGPMILAVMCARILRYRNTQSATGVLFVGVILTFLGELSATLLMRETGHPF